MTLEEMEQNIVRRGALMPCRTAFIDAHTPGSNQKENFSIIGGAFLKVRISTFTLVRQSGLILALLASLQNATIACIRIARLRSFSCSREGGGSFGGKNGNAGEVVLEEGDIFNIPTGIFRGFENIGTDYGLIMAILGGDDAGGGVIWAPQVITDAAEHGLVLGQNGKLYDSKKGEVLPKEIGPMPILTEKELELFGEPSTGDVVPYYVARYWDLMALADRQPAKVIGPDAILRDRPGSEVDFVTRGSLDEATDSFDRPMVLMPARGHWKLSWSSGETILNSGDTCLLPAGLVHSLVPSMTGEVSLYRVWNTDDPAGPTMKLH